MLKDMSREFKKNYFLYLSIAISVAALCAVLVPILAISRYAYPSGDDWSFSYFNYHTIQRGGNLFSLIKSTCTGVSNIYNTWEFRWSCPLIVSLSPAIFGEKFYCLTAFFAVVFILLANTVLPMVLFKTDKYSKLYLIPMICLFCIFLFLYVPAKTDAFYWWSAVAAYTIPYSTGLMFIAAVVKMERSFIEGKNSRLYIPKIIGLGILAFLLGANNFSVSVPLFCVMLVVLGFIIIKRRQNEGRKIGDGKGMHKAVLIMWAALFLCLIVGFISTIISPGFKIQMQQRMIDGNKQTAIMALLNSIKTTAVYIGGYFANIRFVLLLLICIPFAIGYTKDSKYDFKFPLLFTLITFLLLASMIIANIYSQGTEGAGHVLNTWTYGIYLWFMLNEIYYVGFFQRKFLARKKHAIRGMLAKPLASSIWCVALGIAMIAIIYKTNLKQTTVYLAINDLNNGWAARYSAQWEERLVQLKNPEVSQVSFEPIVAAGCITQKYDFCERDDVAYWINEAAAIYYEKEVIELR